MGIDHTVDYISRFGCNPHDLPRNLSLALGTATLTPMEIATGWTTFANGGYKIEPYLILRIEDREGKLYFTANPARVPARETETEETEAQAHAAPDTRDMNDSEALDAEARSAEQGLAEITPHQTTN